MTLSLVILGATISPDEDAKIEKLANETMAQNKTLEVVSIGDMEGSINDAILNLPINASSVLSENSPEDSEEKTWYNFILRMAPCVSVVVYTFSYGAGFGPAIYTWTSELFPSKLKGVGSSIALASRNIVVFIVLLFYPRMIEQLGLSKVFWVHAAIMFIGNIFVFFVMPETRGLTMTQLNEIFGGKISYEKDNDYGDIGEHDEAKDSLNTDRNFVEK